MDGGQETEEAAAELPRQHQPAKRTDHQRPGIRASEITGAVGLSVRRLQAVSKRDFGRTPPHLPTEIRLYRADQMLSGEPPRPAAHPRRGRRRGRVHPDPPVTTAYRHRYGTAPVITAAAAEGPGPQQDQEHASTPRP